MSDDTLNKQCVKCGKCEYTHTETEPQPPDTKTKYQLFKHEGLIYCDECLITVTEPTVIKQRLTITHKKLLEYRGEKQNGENRRPNKKT